MSGTCGHRHADWNSEHRHLRTHEETWAPAATSGNTSLRGHSTGTCLLTEPNVLRLFVA